MEYMEFTGKTKGNAITAACTHFEITSDKLEYEVISEGSTGFLGFNSKPAIIRARVKEEVVSVEEAVEIATTPESVREEQSVEDIARKFLEDVFAAMNLKVDIKISYNEFYH